MLKLICGDSLDVLKRETPNSVNLILCDLPYGTTQNKWDIIIPLDSLWEAYKRILAPKGCVILTATQPFSSMLVMSNPTWFKYEWVWVKTKITGVLNAKKMPVRKHEQILVFAPGTTIYNPQGLIPKGKVIQQGKTSSKNYGNRNSEPYLQEFENYPRDVLEIASEGMKKHPTQKPLALFNYLVLTYSNIGDTVLDSCMGSGTTGVACLQTRRNFIGIEKDPTYFKLAQERIANVEAHN